MILKENVFHRIEIVLDEKNRVDLYDACKMKGMKIESIRKKVCQYIKVMEWFENVCRTADSIMFDSLTMTFTENSPDRKSEILKISNTIWTKASSNISFLLKTVQTNRKHDVNSLSVVTLYGYVSRLKGRTELE